MEKTDEELNEIRLEMNSTAALYFQKLKNGNGCLHYTYTAPNLSEIEEITELYSKADDDFIKRPEELAQMIAEIFYNINLGSFDIEPNLHRAMEVAQCMTKYSGKDFALLLTQKEDGITCSIGSYENGKAEFCKVLQKYLDCKKPVANEDVEQMCKRINTIKNGCSMASIIKIFRILGPFFERIQSLEKDENSKTL
jgi:hypothetical protein